MARIRSIHPGIFTDEAFMQASKDARVLIFGLWCEAWDDGVFEWKPLTLKARIFPVDNVDVPALLNELECLRVFKRFRVHGRDYAALRNFGRFQHPKKPNSSKVLPSELKEYVTPPKGNGEPVPYQDGTGDEPEPHGEERSGREEGIGDEDNKGCVLSGGGGAEPDQTTPTSDLELKLREAAGMVGAASPALRDTGPVWQLIEEGYSLEGVILPLIAARRAAGTKITSWKYVVEAVRERGKAPPARPILVPGDAGAIRPKPGPTHDGRFYVRQHTPQFDAWSAHLRATKGTGSPIDKYGGWTFATEWPPGHAPAHGQPREHQVA